jgi:hypothetical protein
VGETYPASTGCREDRLCLKPQRKEASPGSGIMAAKFGKEERYENPNGAMLRASHMGGPGIRFCFALTGAPPVRSCTSTGAVSYQDKLM